VQILLGKQGEDLILTVSDDGIGLPQKSPPSDGLGLRLMSHGAAVIGAQFSARRNGSRGTVVSCKVKIPNESHSEISNE
jgi:two-component sensor histidine kinase